ncbi:MAG: aminotransferase class I/II-fold pyridoxal phosphate-dependent enzyme [Siphonobacter sp.]
MIQHTPDTFYTTELPGRTVEIDNREFLWCSGTSYLGMSKNPAFVERIMEGLQRVGTNWGSSRNNTLRLKVYDEAESAIAQWMGAPAALTVSSGMLAGQIVMKWLAQTEATYFYAPNAHPAIRGKAFFPTSETYEKWFTALPERIAQTSARRIIIVTDSVGSPHTSTIPFRWIQELPTDKEIILVIDDSHGLGIFGDGKGIFSTLRPPDQVTLIGVASLNKAMGIPAGIILGPKHLLASIRHFSMFSGSSPSSPAYLWAMVHSFDLYKSAHHKLLQNVESFTKQLGAGLAAFHWAERYPAFTTAQPGLHEFLIEQNILTACFPYPGPHDPAITRLVISSLHTESDLRQIASACLAH